MVTTSTGALTPLPSSSSSITVLDSQDAPLLGDSEGQTIPKMKQVTPLPKLQLFLLALTRLSDPIAFTQIFPYINQLVEELRVAKTASEVGFYSGMVDSIYAFAQIFLAYHWGSLSDRIGRRPVMLSSLIGVAIGSTLFGLSNTFWGILAARLLAGSLSGNSVIIQSAVSEITDETNQAKALPLLSVTWNVGAIIGPLIGGLLSYPAERYPDIFGNVQLLKDRPYFLPCFVSSCTTVASLVIAYLFVEETLPRLVQAKKAEPTSLNRSTLQNYGTVNTTNSKITSIADTQGENSSCSSNDPTAATTSDQDGPGILELLKVPKVRAVLVSGTLLWLLSVSWEVVFVLFAYTPVEYGGLSKGVAEIGYALSATGAFGIFAGLVIFPWLNDRYGTVPLNAALMSVWPVCFAIMPALGLVARWSQGNGSRTSDVIVWIGIGIALVSLRVASMAFGSNAILVKMSAPSPELLGAVFGLSHALGALARSVGPTFVSTLFALSINYRILGGNMVWLVMGGLSCLGAFTSRDLVKIYNSEH